MSEAPTKPPLINKAQQRLARARADQIDKSDAWFLHDQAIASIHDRISLVNRTFTRPAVIGHRAEYWAEKLNFDAVCVPDDDTLALELGHHDLIIHAMGLHCANDPVGQLIQMNRAMVPDGLMISAFFGGQTLYELRASLAEAEIAITGGLSPRVFPMAEIRDLGGLLQRAQFALPVADNLDFAVSYEDIFALCHDLRAMAETNTMSGRTECFTRREIFSRAQKHYETSFGENGRLIATFDLIFLTGWSPSADQPKPLRPGSAKHRLADALGVPEINPNKDQSS